MMTAVGTLRRGKGHVLDVRCPPSDVSCRRGFQSVAVCLRRQDEEVPRAAPPCDYGAYRRDTGSHRQLCQASRHLSSYASGTTVCVVVDDEALPRAL